MKIKTLYDQANHAIERYLSTNQHLSFRMNPAKQILLADICKAVENLAHEFIEQDIIEVNVRVEKTNLTLGFECEDMIVKDMETHDFFKAISLTDEFAFRKIATDVMKVEFTIHDILELAYGL